MRKHEIKQEEDGKIQISPSIEYKEQVERQKRMNERKNNKPSRITNQELWDFLVDLQEQQKEILSLLNKE